MEGSAVSPRFRGLAVLFLLLMGQGAVADVVASIIGVAVPLKPVPVGSSFGVGVRVKNTGDTAGHIDVRVVEPDFFGGGLGFGAVAVEGDAAAPGRDAGVAPGMRGAVATGSGCTPRARKSAARRSMS